MSSNRTRLQPDQGEGSFLACEELRIGRRGSNCFAETNWRWKVGEQWAILGPEGSGKSLLVQAILGEAMVASGEVVGPVTNNPGGPIFGHVSPETQRRLALQESSFYQLRWHSGLEQGPRTVADFLAQESVEDLNPFEVGSFRRERSDYADLLRRYSEWLGIRELWNRKLVQLSNGEMRKVLLAHALLKAPDLLILEEPYVGLDKATRFRLKEVISCLMRQGQPVLVSVTRVEDIPPGVTHLLLIDRYRVAVQGSKNRVLSAWRRRFANTSRVKVLPAARSGTNTSSDKKQPVVELSGVSVTGAGRRILRDLTWTLHAGECWALLGPNGAGKSTLLSLIQGDHPQVYSEPIRLFGRRTDSTRTLWLARQCIGWMSPELHQHYPGSWTAEEVVCSGFFNSIGLYERCSLARQREARRWLSRVGMKAIAPVCFGELSFGQQRLVLLARAAVKRPKLLILDEPCQSLDAAQRGVLLAAVDRAVATTSGSLLFVTHYEKEVPTCISHTLRLANGRIIQAGFKRD